MTRRLAPLLAWLLLFQWLLVFAHCFALAHRAAAAVAPLTIEICGAEGRGTITLPALDPEAPPATASKAAGCPACQLPVALPPEPPLAISAPIAWSLPQQPPWPAGQPVAPARAPPQQPRAPPFA